MRNIKKQSENNPTFKTKRVLITGGLGFIGSNLAMKLVEAGADVEVYDALLSNFGGNLFNVDSIKKEIRITRADLRDEKKIAKSIKNKDIIFNLAGNLSHVDSMSNPLMDLDINCRAQLCLLEACRKKNPGVKIVFAGTRNQYGKALYLPVDEKHIQEPTDINGINSIAAEKYHFLYFNVYGIKTVSLRMSNTFGPRHQMMHPRQGVLNWFVRMILDNKKIQLYGEGAQIRDVNYVSETIDALLLLAKLKDNWGEAFNLGGHPVSLIDFVKKAITVASMGSYEHIDFPKERKVIEVGNYVADISKIKEATGWEPNCSVNDGLIKTMEYYKRNKKYYW